jgi:hypothetical protein
MILSWELPGVAHSSMYFRWIELARARTFSSSFTCGEVGSQKREVERSKASTAKNHPQVVLAEKAASFSHIWSHGSCDHPLYGVGVEGVGLTQLGYLSKLRLSLLFFLHILQWNEASTL